ncbi:unnamed protein product [Eruca vesicaria subsp. sativa]|uniref:Uncharacterized protein n=1 Tax=Eruca vesicaria subsp. sativa TaxID=29727 RepID=A0ABC8J3X1_ERUVS|nr:unnamed protein product [Eruca vesicaria subsp. sativa]
MPNQPLRVAVLLSGGVDSSVSLSLLHAVGHSCTAFYLKIWFQDHMSSRLLQLIKAKANCYLSGIELEDKTEFIDLEEVRKLATQFDLPNKDTKDSQGICLLGKVYFLVCSFGEMEEVILEAETGDFLGNHRGFWFYTIGQRRGLRLPSGPWYVVEKDTKNNVVRWLLGTDKLSLQVRHGPGFYGCSFEIEAEGDVAVVHLDEDDHGLPAGQFAAFYEGTTILS